MCQPLMCDKEPSSTEALNIEMSSNQKNEIELSEVGVEDGAKASGRGSDS